MSERISEQKALQAVGRRGRYVRMIAASALLIWAAFGCALLYLYAIGYGFYPLGVFLLISGTMLLRGVASAVNQKPRLEFCIPEKAIDNELKARERDVLGFWRMLEGMSAKACVCDRIAFRVLPMQITYLCLMSDIKRQNGLVVVTEKFMEEMDGPEAESLVGHEIGHLSFKENILIEAIGDMSYFFRFNFFLLMSCVFLSISGMVWFVPAFGNAELLLLLAAEVVSLVLAFIIMPRIKAAAHRQEEYLADAYGCYLVGTDALADALKKMGGRSEGTGIRKYLSYKIGMRSHPATSDRAKAIRALRP